MLVTLKARLAIATASLVVAFAALEAAMRSIDGYAIGSPRLRSIRPPVQIVSSPAGKWLDPNQADAYASSLPVAPGVDRAWFRIDPEPIAAPAIDPLLEHRYRAHPGYELLSVYEWNLEFLRAISCGRDRPAIAGDLEHLDDVFVFRPSSPVPRPTYRFLRRAHYPSGLVTNEYGWRGRAVPINKPAGRIRIAFVGASTTSDAHSDPFSYPEYVERWLRTWGEARRLPVTLDVVNAGREGITSESIAAIVRYELLPLRPDLVVYYEGSNQFWPNAFVGRPLMRAWRTLSLASAAARYSAAVVRAKRALDRLRNGAEPAKPPLPVAWPPDLDERDPALDDARLPVQLPAILHDLDAIRTDLSSSGGTLMPSSFVWLARHGMVVDRARDAFLYRHLNEYYWPFSYAHLRRFARFQNRVLRKYAAVHGLPFNDLARAYPLDPRLFTDAIHMTPAGVKLKAWLVFQQLVPVIERRIADGSWPVADPGGRTVHPAFAGRGRRLVSMSELRRSCDAGSSPLP